MNNNIRKNPYTVVFEWETPAPTGCDVVYVTPCCSIEEDGAKIACTILEKIVGKRVYVRPSMVTSPHSAVYKAYQVYAYLSEFFAKLEEVGAPLPPFLTREEKVALRR